MSIFSCLLSDLYFFSSVSIGFTLQSLISLCSQLVVLVTDFFGLPYFEGNILIKEESLKIGTEDSFFKDTGGIQR